MASPFDARDALERHRDATLDCRRLATSVIGRSTRRVRARGRPSTDDSTTNRSFGTVWILIEKRRAYMTDVS